MRSLNWDKVPHGLASKTSSLWCKSIQGKFDIKINIDPSVLVQLFAQPTRSPEVQKLKKGIGLDPKTCFNLDIFLKKYGK